MPVQALGICCMEFATGAHPYEQYHRAGGAQFELLVRRRHYFIVTSYSLQQLLFSYYSLLL